jgi:hypothetical protein
MPDDRPTARELIETVREFLHDKAMPASSGHMAFQLRIAANLLAVAGRELESRVRADAQARARLGAILGRDGELESLESELVERIRAGELGPGHPALFDHLWKTAEDKLRIANPRYLKS